MIYKQRGFQEEESALLVRLRQQNMAKNKIFYLFQN